MDKRFKKLNERLQFIKKTRAAAKEYFSSTKHKKELGWFMSWLDAQVALVAGNLDKCPKCKDDPYKTPGGCPCEHCGAIGQQPWGG